MLRYWNWSKIIDASVQRKIVSVTEIGQHRYTIKQELVEGNGLIGWDACRTERQAPPNLYEANKVSIHGNSLSSPWDRWLALRALWCLR